MSDHQKLIDLAMQKIQSGQRPEAEAIYQQILTSDPNHPEALHFLGVFALQGGRAQVAVNLIERATILNPEDVDALNNLGQAYESLGRLDDAMVVYRKAIAMVPDFAEAHSNLGDALILEGKPEEAVSCYERALESHPNEPEILTSLGVAFSSMGKHKNGITHLRHALEISPEDPVILTNLGIALQWDDEPEEAIDAFERAITADPDFVGAKKNLSALLRQLKMQEKTKRRFVKISERDFSSAIFDNQEFEVYTQNIKRAKWTKVSWKGLTLMKDPMTITIYLQLIQELKPKTILEFGTFDGGSALWMNDMIKSLGLNCDIHTFDINSERVKLPRLKNVTFHELDNFKIREFNQSNSELLSSLEHPILAIEDSHQNVMELLVCIDDYLIPGDYLIVEDTLDYSKYEIVMDFLRSHDYEVDTHYCDFWGPNNSWNINSILQKTMKSM